MAALDVPYDYGAKGGTLLNLTVPGMVGGNNTVYTCRFEPPLAYAAAAATYSDAWWGGLRGDALGGALDSSNDDDQYNGAIVEVNAAALDVSTLHCVTPPWGAWRCATVANLVVTQNGSDVAVALDYGNFTYSTNLSYHFFEVKMSFGIMALPNCTPQSYATSSLSSVLPFLHCVHTWILHFLSCSCFW